MYKNQLQQLAQKNYLSLPTYSCIRDGPDHAPRFKATVTYNGKTFESPEFCSTYKQAQLAAAEVALSALTQKSSQSQKLRTEQNALAESPPNVRVQPDATSLDSPKGAKNEHEQDDIGSVLTNSHMKEETLQHLQDKPSPSELLSHTRIQVVTLEAPSKSETSEKGTNKEQRHDTIASVLQNRHCKEEAIQQSQVRVQPDATSLDSPKGAKNEREQDDIGSVLTNSHMKEETLQHLQDKPSPSELLSHTRIQVVTLEAPSKSETSEKGTNKEQRHDTTASVLQDRHCKEEAIQQSQDMHKNQLQQLAQKGGFNLPSYSCIREGPPHAPRFKATVTFNGETFESPVFCSTLRQAEHSAATVALKSLSQNGPSLNDSAMYKNLLQEIAQREGIPLPVYSTSSSGIMHKPVFTCTVKVAGMVFSGAAAKTRKQAEKNAAMVAWSALKQCGRQGSSTSRASDKGGQTDHEPTVIEHVVANSNTKEETIRESDVESVSLPGAGVGALSLQELSASEISYKDTNKELEQNVFESMQGNRHRKEDIQQHNRSFPKQISSSTKIIRVFPRQDAPKLSVGAKALPCSNGAWVAVEVNNDATHGQNNASNQDD